jgi:hypothetical protein
MPAPQLCSVFLTPELLNNIETALCVIEKNNLVEVALNVDDVNWFATIEEHFFQSITSQIHVQRDSIYFTGAFSPSTESLFQTKRVPLSSINEPLSFNNRTINLALLDSTIAKEKINEIEYLDKELTTSWERAESLENLKEACIGVKHSSISEDGTETDKMVRTLLAEIGQLEHHIQKVEQKIEAASVELCKVVLDISIGDRLLTQSSSPNRNIEIVVELVSYYSGTLRIEGPKVLKNRQVGKRHEIAYVKIRNDNERN